ncbi:putative ribosomal protein P2 [Dioscorea sansibarensis]
MHGISSGYFIYYKKRRYFGENPNKSSLPPKKLKRELHHQPFKMKIIAAYLLALLGGNLSPSADDLKNILGSVGAETDEDKFEFFLSEVKGIDITELIALGKEKLATVPGGGGGALVVATPAGGEATAGPAAAEPKTEEKVEEKEESDDVRSLMIVCYFVLIS